MKAARLLAAAFYQHPLWKRDRYATHCRDWQRFIQRVTWARYHADAEFRLAYDAYRDARRANAGAFLAALPWRAAA